jgi:hypothetical protein
VTCPASREAGHRKAPLSAAVLVAQLKRVVRRPAIIVATMAAGACSTSGPPALSGSSVPPASPASAGSDISGAVLFNAWEPEASAAGIASRACADIGAKAVIGAVSPQGDRFKLLRYRCSPIP